MSNPGVIVLHSANCRGTNFKRFQVEDNIGESIHIHVDNMRFDFTIEEFSSSFPGRKTFPLLMMNDHTIGGYVELVEAVSADPYFGRMILNEGN